MEVSPSCLALLFSYSLFTSQDPALPRSPPAAIRNDLRGGNVFAGAVANAWGRWLLGATRCLSITLERNLTGEVAQPVGQLGSAQVAEHLPVNGGDGHHHAGVGLPNLQRQVVGR